MNGDLRVAINRFRSAREALQEAVDKICKPTSTGYMRTKEQWEVVGAFDMDGSIGLTLSPPEHDYEHLRRVSSEQLDALKKIFECDRVEAISFVYDQKPSLRYVMYWKQ